MFEYIGGAVAIGLVLLLLNRFFTVRLDLNKQEDRVTLWSLYAIVQGMDGPADRQETLVKVVREALGQPEMEEDHILEEYGQQRQLNVEKVRGLSGRKRIALLVWAYRIRCGDEQTDSEEIDRWAEDLSRTLGLDEEEELDENGRPLRESLREYALNVLDLEEGATEEQIDKAFQKKRMATHPDRERDPEKKKEAEARFKEIQAAYRTLTGKRSPSKKR